MSDFDDFVNSNDIVVVDFHATWCNPCKALAPKLTQLCESLGVSLYKIDVEEYPDLAKRYSVDVLPTILFFKGGMKLNHIVLGANFSKIKEILEKI